MKVTASLVWSDSTGEYISGTLDKTYREIENADSIMLGFEQRTYYITLELVVYGFDDEYGATVVVNMRDYPNKGDLREMEFTASTKDDVLTWGAVQ